MHCGLDIAFRECCIFFFSSSASPYKISLLFFNPSIRERFMVRPFYKRKKVWLLGLVVFLGFFVLLRDVLIAKGAEVYISKSLEKEGWKIESRFSSKNNQL